VLTEHSLIQAVMMSPYHTYGLLLVASFIRSSTAAGKCYRQDGSSAGPEYTPCNSYTKYSMCYRSGVADGISPDFGCFPNGLSMTMNPFSGEKYYWRQMCTDASWESPSCLKAFDKCGKVSWQIFCNASRLTSS